MSAIVLGKRLLCLLALVGLVSVPGCTGAAATPKTVPVTGTIMYKGQPVEGASVAFQAKDAARAATGVTGPDGKFKLSTFGTYDGAVPGEHTITVSKMEGTTAPTSSGPPDPNSLAQQAGRGTDGAQKAGPKHLLPEKYAGAGGGLKRTVDEKGSNDFLIELAD